MFLIKLPGSEQIQVVLEIIMATNDYFADIAMTAHPVSSTDKEVVPVEIKEKLISGEEGNYKPPKGHNVYISSI